MITISILLLVAALITIVAAAMGKCPLWIPLVVMWLLMALQVLPIK